MKKNALTMLEVIISTVILALVITGLVNIFISGKGLILHSRSRMAGGEIGKYFLDPLQMQVIETNWGSNCLSNNTLCASTTQKINDVNYTVSHSTSNAPVANLRRVTTTITWNETTP